MKVLFSGKDLTHWQRWLSRRTSLYYIIPAVVILFLIIGLWQLAGVGSAMQAVTPTATVFINPPPTVTGAAAVMTATNSTLLTAEESGQPILDGQALNTTAATSTTLPTITESVTGTSSAAAIQESMVGTDRILDRTLNVLILGSDRRPDTPNWRTDVMMIAALDLDGGSAGVISIPRDLYIDLIPNHQPNRINVIDYLGERDEPNGGGPALLKQLIQDRMNIRIDHYVRFDFSSFQEVVDALGGVDVEIDCPYYDYFGLENVVLNLQPGLTHLSGAEALVYVRSRRIGGDLDRARRQQRFVWAVRNQVLNQNLLPRVPALYQTLDDSIQTDVGILNTIRIVRFALNLDEEDIHGFVLTPPTLLTPGWRSGMSIFVPNWAEIRAATEKLFESEPFLATNTPAYCP